MKAEDENTCEVQVIVAQPGFSSESSSDSIKKYRLLKFEGAEFGPAESRGILSELQARLKPFLTPLVQPGPGLFFRFSDSEPPDDLPAAVNDSAAELEHSRLEFRSYL